MLIPSLACQASCKYCFGPHKGAIIDSATVKESIRFIRNIAVETSAKEISIIFHGGEPLLMPIANWKILFDEVKTQLAGYKIDMNMQSNLWNLDDDFMKLFCDNNVSIGTSLDGPKELCDLNRGEGYYDQTFAAIKKSNAFGCSVSGIATITKQTLPHAQDIAKYFRNNGLSLVLHGALSGLDKSHDVLNDVENAKENSPYALNVVEYGKMITGLFPWYVKNRKHIRISTLDYFVKGIVTGNPSVCTHKDCLGMFLAIAPTGNITSCQRLAGRKEFRMGNIFDKPSLADLYKSQAALAELEREQKVAERCADCDFYPICKGGCYYNAIASGDGVIDPLCEAYKEIYAFVREKVMDEMQSEENINAITNRPVEADDHPLLRKGAYISLADKTHPTQIADNARAVLALYELSKTNDPFTAAQNLYEQKICGDTGMTAKLLENMRTNMYNKHKSLNNCYVHITSNCNLRCNHCYANAGDCVEEMRIEALEVLIKEALTAKFRQLIITGGEPLVHTRRNEMLKLCATYKGKGTNLVLRTNQTGSFTESDFKRIAQAFDQVVVSVDGNEQTHDARRGKGSYRNMTENLERYTTIATAISETAELSYPNRVLNPVRDKASIPKAAELSLACVMNARDINGEPGLSVRQLAKHLNVRRIRFRPLLPIGRASQLDEPVMCEGLMQHVSPDDMLKTRINPLTTCGIGQNLFIKPDGSAYPCYAWCGEHTYIGNVAEEGLPAVLASHQFTRLVACTVDTIEKCKDCAYRYLCGGACRAWDNRESTDLNAPPVRCDHLQQTARNLIDTARNYL